MALLLSVIALALLATGFALPCFEFSFAVLLITPLVYFVLLHFAGPSMLLGWLAVVLVVLALIYLSGSKFGKLGVSKLRAGFDGILVFALSFSAFYLLSLSWPDFIATGERLRDYAIQAELIKHPLTPDEPWMSGASLQYYIYWYRVGALFSALFDLPAWSVYHQMVAFSLAFYLSTIYCICRRALGFATPVALCCAVFVACGSNVAGVIDFLNKSDNWWGPSRVIPGAINEFPVWSFLLGDLHPHYLNLAAIPFLILLYLSSSNPGNRVFLRIPIEHFALFAALLLIPVFWLRAANAWEVPIWGGLVAILISLLLLCSKARLLHVWKRVIPTQRSLLSLRAVLAFGAIAACCAILFLSSPKMPAGEGNPVRFVADKVAASRTFDLLQHWGFPLLLIACANISLITSRSIQILLALFLAASVLFDSAAVLLYSLFMVNCIRLFSSLALDQRKPAAIDMTRSVMEAVGLAALGLVLLPEVVFLDDPYGGENERMNTIFKIYTSCWVMLHLFAFWLSAQGSGLVGLLLKHRPSAWIVTGLLMVSFLGFAAHTIPLRQTANGDVTPREQGLNEIEKRFPGAALTIKELLRLPQGVVLEAQGNAYDYTSFVSTLSSQQAYLGWANHVGLLTKQHGEVSRREKVTREFYGGHDCEAKRKILIDEKITYVVFGTLEKAKFPEAKAEDFACLKKLFEHKEYVLYGG